MSIPTSLCLERNLIEKNLHLIHCCHSDDENKKIQCCFCGEIWEWSTRVTDEPLHGKKLTVVEFINDD